MKYLLRLVLACAALSMVSSCVESLNDSPYKLTCSIDKTLAPDSVSLFLLEDDYNRVYKVATVAVDSATGAYLFDGQIEVFKNFFVAGFGVKIFNFKYCVFHASVPICL